MSAAVAAILVLFAGLFSVFCAVKDYDWFMNSSRAWLFVKLFGRNGARAFYVLLGLFLVGMSIFLFVR